MSGDPDAFEGDTQKLVLDEVEQRDSICASLLAHEKALTGYHAPPHRKLVPIVVPAGGYPSDVFARSHVDDIVTKKGWLQDPALEPLCILDLSEVEILESLQEAHFDPGEILARWKRSGLRNIGFKNFVHREVNPNLRTPSRIKSRVDPALDAVLARTC